MRHEYQVKCPDSSIQATLAGRFGTSEYGKSKKAGGELLLRTHVNVLVAL